MKNGDISNIVQPRILLVFEGSLGFINTERMRIFNEYATHGDWFEAWSQFQLDTMMMRKLWDVVQRQHININVVTFIGADEADAAREGLQELMDEHHLPVSDVIVTTAERLAREIAFMPDVARIYDGNADTAMMYGRRGTLLRHYDDLGQ
jgi:hypothetical protein